MICFRLLSHQSINIPFSMAGSVLPPSPPSPPLLPCLHPPPLPPALSHSHYLLSACYMLTPELCSFYMHYLNKSMLETVNCLASFVGPGPSRSRHQAGINRARILLGGNACVKGNRVGSREGQEGHQTPSEGERERRWEQVSQTALQFKEDSV